MKHKGHVLIAARVHPVLTEGLMAQGYHIKTWDGDSFQIALQALKECTGVITSNRLVLDRQVLDAAPMLEWIGRMGSGMEIIDTEYAHQNGIACFSSPEGNANAVAEHAVGLLLALTSKIKNSSNQVRQGIWKREANRGVELEGKTLGVIGFGHTGSALAAKLQGFGMRLLTYDIKPELSVPEYVTAVPLSTIQQEADIVSFHVPYTPDTHHYFDRRFLRSMRKPFILINTSRGAVADNDAIVDGLEKKWITGAALDVVAGEPRGEEVVVPPEIASLCGRDEVIITPHIAGYSEESIYKMSKVLLDKLLLLRDNV